MEMHARVEFFIEGMRYDMEEHGYEMGMASEHWFLNPVYTRRVF